MNDKSRRGIDGNEGANLLNIQYGVCFGVIFALCFTLEKTAGSYAVAMTVQRSQVLFFSSMLLYFFLDWGLANFLRERLHFSLWRILMLSTAIWFLGAVVILTNCASPLRFVMLGVYATTVGGYQFVTHMQDFYPIPSGSRWFGRFISAIMILIGLYFFYSSVLVVTRRVCEGTCGNVFLVAVIVSLLLIKVLNVSNLYSHLREVNA